jgi:hypothetical protein
MKKVFSLTLISLLAVIILSWGTLGHQTVGRIAEHHLSDKSKAALAYYLGSQSLSEVSTWADDVRNQAEYRHTGSWHFLNLPMGLSYSEFEKTVTTLKEDNVYKALLQCEQTITSSTKSRQEKAEALKFIVHFVGDLHQPMHVSRAEDRGGNTIQVNYEGKGTNLHSLWDSRLLEHQGLSVDQLAAKCDHATPAQIKLWQNDPLIKWLWESYQISTQLYSEVDQMNKRTITEEYYQKHIPIIEDRIEKAGIRLAGVLNQLFGATSFPKAQSTAPGATTPSSGKTIAINEISSRVGEVVQVCDKVYGFKEFSGMTLLNMGADYPNQQLTIVLKGEANNGYQQWKGKTLCVNGKLIDYKGKPEIIITDPKMIRLGGTSTNQ